MMNASTTFILTGGPVYTGTHVFDDQAIVIRNGCIDSFISTEELDPSLDIFDVNGRLIVPGFVCAHHHFYSALATGMPVEPAACFIERLENLWWKLDKALSLDHIRLSARWSLAQCLRNGITTVYDHHASYGAIRGSLAVISEEIEAAGISGVVCFEVSDRNGPAAAVEAIEENLAFRSTNRVKGLFGLHAAFTLGDQTFAKIRQAVPPDTGFHIHCAEDMIDVRENGGEVIKRLESFGILRDSSLLIHGVHLRQDELETVAAHGTTLVHCPDSNLNNGVGTFDLCRGTATGLSMAAGTDGMHSSMLKSYKTALLANHSLHGRPDTGFAETGGLYQSTQNLPGHYFDDISGILKAGTRADIAVLDYRPHTPVTTNNIWGHLLYGAAEQPVFTTIAGGKIVYNHGYLADFDEKALAEECTTASRALWEKIQGRDT
jgi:putative selenium metabolism protein SsnA